MSEVHAPMTWRELMAGDFPEPTYREDRLVCDRRAAHSFFLNGWISHEEYLRLSSLIGQKWGRP